MTLYDDNNISYPLTISDIFTIEMCLYDDNNSICLICNKLQDTRNENVREIDFTVWMDQHYVM